MDIPQKEPKCDGRNYSIDLLKILSMIMVVILHINLFGGFLDSASISNNLGYIWTINFFEEICIIAVNVFVVISSWFLSSSELKKIKTKRIFHLIVSMYFWFLISTAIAFSLGVRAGIFELLSQIPIIGKSYGFITGYIILYLLSPYLNILTSQLSRKSWFVLVIGLFFIFSFCAPIIRNGYLYINSGYSFAWFIIVYLIVGFIKSHTQWNNYSYKVYLSLFLLLTIIGTIARRYYPTLYVSKGHYNDPLVLCSALSCFLFFASIKLNNRFFLQCYIFFCSFICSSLFYTCEPFY